MTEFTIPTWVLWAFGIAIVFSVGLNGGPYLPWFRELRPRRIEARWVGYVGLTLALWLWIILNPAESATHTGVAWLIICLTTLLPNTAIHLYQRDNGNDGNDDDQPGLNRTGHNKRKRPNDPARMRDLVLDIIAERWQAHDALRAQDEMLRNLVAIVDPVSAHRPEDAMKTNEE